MNKKIRMFLIAVLFSFSVLVSGSAIISMNNSTANAANVWSEVTFEQRYLQGDTLIVPDRTLTVGGKETSTSVTVTLPDGTTTTSKTVQMTDAGKYTVKYTAMVGGRVYSQIEEITAQYATAVYSKEETSIAYGTYKHAPAYEGLMVRLAQNDKLVFNQILDLNNVTQDMTIFSFFATADVIGRYDFKRLVVQFTDVEDQNCYFRMRFLAAPSDRPQTYMLAGANGQPMSGWEGGSWNKLHVENQWGAQVNHSFMCSYSDASSIGKTSLELRYDAASKSVYVGNTFVIDFDNPKYFSTLWKGFVSGQVKMSVWADDYISNSANFMITKAYGIDLSSDTMEETTPPAITVNTDYTTETMPDAKVGMQYAVPTATAFDAYSGVCSVKTNVYYNYGSPTASNTAIVDGKFKAEYTGNYAIVYEAEDYMGNVAKKVYWVSAKSELAAPTVTLNETLAKEVNAGELVTLPACSVSGGSGMSQVKIYVNDGSGDVEVTDSFRPNKVTTYTVKYIATDYIGQTGTYTANLKVNKGTVPVFVDEPVFPKYLIAGAYYTIPDLYAEDYTSGELVKKLATVTVKDSNGTQTIAQGQQYVPEVANNMDKVQITYSIDGATKVMELPTVKAKDDDGVYVGNYFDLQGATLTLGDEESMISATSANGHWTFANSLVAHEVNVNIRTLPEKGNYDGIRITFTDADDSSIAIRADILKLGNKCNVVTDITKFDTEIGFTSNASSNLFEIGYKNGNFTIGGADVAVKSMVDGRLFEGFPSGKIYINIAFINATAGQAAYNIIQLNGQRVNTSTIDRVTPKIVIVGVRGGTFAYDSTITLPAALAGDTLDPNVTFSLTVKSPDNKVLKDTSGLLLENVDPTKEYEIHLDAYGQFKVNYTATDSFSGRKSTLVYAINVDDSEGPMIIFDSPFQKQVKVGEIIGIPNYTVTDNVCDPSEIVTMKFCLTPDDTLMVLPDNSNSVITTKVGTYQLWVYATDNKGNATLARMNVVVTE